VTQVASPEPEAPAVGPDPADDPNAAAAAARYCRARAAHWDDVARRFDRRAGVGGYYHRRLADVYRFLVRPGQRVLELGCGRGDLLAAVEPGDGVGIDFSAEMVARARRDHPDPRLRFVQADAHDLPLDPDRPFDVIILSDLVNDLWDVQRVLEGIRPLCHPHTRVILNFYSHLWEWPLRLAQRVKLARPTLEQNWLTRHDMSNLLALARFEAIKTWQEVLWPVRTPLVDAASNKVLVKLPVLRHAALANVVVARPVPEPQELGAARPTVSVIVPARNEAGNVEQIFRRTPQMGGGTELVFVEGHSSDDTYTAVERAIAARPGCNARLFRQSGKGKGDAVRLGYAQARGDILMILDADLTVPPEDLPRFYDALARRQAEFVNGVRLVYPMERQAMRLINLAGNKFFGAAFSYLLGQPIRDTLCGTKVLYKADYERLAASRAYFGEFDPFGDFDLLFGAAKLGLKIVDVPIRYRDRTYGTTNIDRWRHGWLLLKMVAFAATRIKFV
jgi:SAM-dependent methyltransferase